MDESLKQVHGSFQEFRNQVEDSPLDPTYEEWGVTDLIVPAERSVPPIDELIRTHCGDAVLGATWEVQVFFPRFVGVSGGAAQLFFVGRSEGPLLWFTY